VRTGRTGWHFRGAGRPGHEPHGGGRKQECAAGDSEKWVVANITGRLWTSSGQNLKRMLVAEIKTLDAESVSPGRLGVSVSWAPLRMPSSVQIVVAMATATADATVLSKFESSGSGLGVMGGHRGNWKTHQRDERRLEKRAGRELQRPDLPERCPDRGRVDLRRKTRR
jgi:hypothetical protein